MAGVDADVVTPPSGGGASPEHPPGEDAAPPPAEATVAVVTQPLGDYVRAWWTRTKNGDSGMLPVLLALLIIAVVFQIISPNHVFLHSDNLVNLFQQSAVFMVLGMAEIFVLLLSEIDLSVGFMGAFGGVIAVQFVQPVTRDWPWWAAIIVALLSCAIVGAMQGTLVSRLGIPSFIVTLGGSLILNGVLLILLLLGPFSGEPSILGDQDSLVMLHNLMWGNIDPTVSWVVMGVTVAAFGGLLWWRDDRRRRTGLTAPPASLTVLRIVVLAIVGIVVVAICNTNRGVGFVVIEGVPWVVPIVLFTLLAWMILLERTRFGRYVYAIGGNPEAARRAGIDVAGVRTAAFALCAMTAGLGGILYASYQGGMTNNVNGGQLVLYAVAAAVIGGTSLFGGRGRIIHGLLGGLVIGAIYNGLYTLGLDVKYQYIVTGFVLLVSLTIDSVSRRGAARAGAFAR